MEMMPSRTILWFRRDLRLCDNPALLHAARDGRTVTPVFVLDPTLIAPSGAPRLAFMYRALRSLNESLDGHLVVRSGDPVSIIPELSAELMASEVVVSRDYAPYGRRRDGAVGNRLGELGVDFVGKGSPYAVPPGTVVKSDGMPYSVFTPFSKRWRQIGWADPVEPTDVAWFGAGDIPSEPIPDEPALSCSLPEAGERAAHARWEAFIERGLETYDTLRNEPAVPGTSGMSPYLRWGQVHPRQLLADLDDLDDSPAHSVFRQEIAWRDFYADVLFHHPDSARHNLQSKMDKIVLDTGAAAHRRFDQWAIGRTGYPIVDAGMRQLLATGWMHNRVRMIVASFLVKDLHLPWQWGARHFMRHLVDGDIASNQHGWQWTAGTGTDAAPYFRIFNPASQSLRFDPSGDYIRRWVPELEHVPAPDIHAPASSRAGLPLGAQAPMLDHGVERVEALRRYRDAMGR